MPLLPPWSLPLIVISVYLAVVLYIGIFAFRKGKATGEACIAAIRSAPVRDIGLEREAAPDSGAGGCVGLRASIKASSTLSNAPFFILSRMRASSSGL